LKSRRFFSSVSFGLVLSAGILNAVLAIAATPSPTTTVLTISTVNSVPMGTLVTLRASVSSSGTPVSPGLVLFCNAGATYCEDFNILGQAQLTPGGTASLNLILPVGEHIIRAEFRGTNSNAPSSSSAESLVVSGKYPTVTTISAVQGTDTVALRGKVTSLGHPAQTGTLSFPDTANHLLPLATLTVGSPTLTFAPTGASSGPSISASGVVADFNRDGKLDQLAFDSTNSALVVLLGNGDGTFTAAPSMPTDATPGAVTVGDFNNDDILDLAIANYGEGTVSIYLGNGDGTFSVPTVISVASVASIGLYPINVSVGDFNNDGNADVVVGSGLGAGIWLGNGKGEFTAVSSQKEQMPYSYSPVLVADLNGDGNDDLVFNLYESVEVWLGNGDGTFVEAPAPSAPCEGTCQDVELADFNSDGKPDLAVAEGSPSGGLFILLGNGDGTFGSPVQIDGAPPKALVFGDFNGDGKVDICESFGEPYVEVFLGNGDGTFAYSQVIYTDAYFSTMTAGDFNGDGMTDLALTSPTSVLLSEWYVTAAASRVTVTGNIGTHNVFANYEGDANHLASVSSIIGVQGPKVATAISLKMSQERVSRGETVQLTASIAPSNFGDVVPSGTVTFFTGGTELGSSVVSHGEATLSTDSLPIGDQSMTASYSGDTNFSSGISPELTLIVVNVRPNKTTTILSVLPSFRVSAGTLVTLSVKVTSSGDPVGPGGEIVFCDAEAPHCEDMAILGRAQLTSRGVATLAWRPAIGFHRIKAVYQGANLFAASDAAIRSLAVTGSYPTTTTLAEHNDALTSTVSTRGELSPTGELDIVDASDQTDVVASARLRGRQTVLTLAPASLAAQFGGATGLAIGDVNGDGIPDVVTANGNGSATVFLGKGDGTFVLKSTLDVGLSAYQVVIGDFNSDGKPDLAVTADGANGNGMVTVFLGNGDGSFTQKSAVPVGDLYYAVASGDFNGDGIPDLAIVDFNEKLTILLGNGDGTFANKVSMSLPSGYSSTIAVSDLNGDGIPDLVLSSYGNCVIVLLGKGDGTFGPASQFGAGRYSTSALIADFNGDGIPDIAATGDNYDAAGNFLNGGVTILLGKGDGTFTPLPSPSVGTDYPNSAAVVDFNGDGIPDLAATLYPSGIAVLLGKGDGTFVTSFYAGEGYPLVAGDLNGDGVPDLVLANDSGQNIGALLGEITTTTMAAFDLYPTRPPANLQAIYSGDTYHSVSKSEPVANGTSQK
jgi:hypothetical protein